MKRILIKMNNLENFVLKFTDHSSTYSTSIKRTPWTELDDYRLKKAIQRHGLIPWKDVAYYVPGRTDKQCRERWLNHLNPFIKNGDWSPEEDDQILKFHRMYGSKWSKLAKLMPMRTDNAIKNRFHVIKKANGPNNSKCYNTNSPHRDHENVLSTSSSENEKTLRRSSSYEPLVNSMKSCCSDSTTSMSYHGYDIAVEYAFQNSCNFLSSKTSDQTIKIVNSYLRNQGKIQGRLCFDLQFDVDCFSATFEDSYN